MKLHRLFYVRIRWLGWYRNYEFAVPYLTKSYVDIDGESCKASSCDIAHDDTNALSQLQVNTSKVAMECELWMDKDRSFASAISD